MCKVANTTIVNPQDLWITYDRDKPTLTVFACHPKGSAGYRVVVTADLVGGDGSLERYSISRPSVTSPHG
jgi:sortase (surface protein transpeptidase)